MKKYSLETVVGLFVVIGIVCVAYMTFKLGKISLFDSDYYPLYANFGTVSGLRVGSPVEINGIEVGRVEELTIDQNKQVAVVRLAIRRGINIYGDANASIKTAGLIGDKLVSIDPGGGDELLKPNGRITETTSAVDLEGLIGKYAFGNVDQKKRSSE